MLPGRVLAEPDLRLTKELPPFSLQYQGWEAGKIHIHFRSHYE